MKNIHVLPTDKPSRLHLGNSGLVLCDLNFGKNTINGQHIYITNDEEIKEGDYRLNIQRGYYKKVDKEGLDYYNKRNDVFKKIILTTDQDLINDGVQAIDEEFLEWFVKNPSCERVDLDTFSMGNKVLYNVVFSKEEPKQETLEEAVKRLTEGHDDLDSKYSWIEGFEKGAKWQAERMYSKEDLMEAFKQSRNAFIFEKDMPPVYECFENWFEQFKKK